jgi:membrane associated rhomboid family serine protease
VVTLALIAINVVVFLHEVGLPPQLLDAFIERWGMIPERQTWALTHAPAALRHWALPIVTSMFVHGGWLHLLGNMLFLWVFGEGVEARLGSGRYLTFYLAVGVVASLAQYLVDPMNPMPMVGASGAIAGVLGGYLLLFPRSRVTVLVPILFLPLFFELPALFFLLYWFVEQLFFGSMAALTPVAGAASTAWWAHVGGFLAGAGLVYVLKPPSLASIRPAPRNVRAPRRDGWW